MGAVMLWGWDNGTSLWRKIHVDAAGDLQVDVLTSALPTGAATAANQALIIADTNVLVAEQGRCYGYDGAAWQTLLVQSDVYKNLRVTLYGEGDLMTYGRISDTSINYATRKALITSSKLFVHGTAAAAYVIWAAGALGDATSGNSALPVMNWGWNGASWDRLRVESNVAFNLRVKLYDGANGIDSQPVDLNLQSQRGLITNSVMKGRFAASDYRDFTISQPNIDNLGAGINALRSIAFLYGFDGTSWDRLRTYGTGILKVGRAEVGLLDVRKVAVGQVGAAGARKLYWMLLNPSAGSSLIELTDAVAGGGVVVADHFDTTRDGHMITFDPPMEFATGLYLETFTNMTSVIFGYL